MKYHAKGTITYRVVVRVDQEIEADSDDQALDGLENEYAPMAPWLGSVDVDDDDLEITPIDESPLGEDVAMRAAGAPMLPGF